MKTDEGSFVNDKLPRWGQWVMVEAPSVRCPGFLDPNGLWRDARDGHIIENVRSWSTMEANQGKIRPDDTFGKQSHTLTTG
jgi:hypothetical protein